MTASAQRRVIRRLLLPALTAIAVSVGAISPVAAQAPSSPEAYLLSLVNDARAETDLVALQWDARLANVAQWRSDDMVANNYFGHVSWEKLSRRIQAENIVWYALGEALVKGTPRSEMESAEEAIRTWRASAPHWDSLTNPDYNYIALGMKRDANGWYYWTALLLKGPDRTAPKASMAGTGVGASSGGGRNVTVSWSGNDVPLSVLTAGLKDFRLQMRVGAGSWTLAADWTTATSKSFNLQAGKTYSFRVKARDKSTNKSTWTAPLTVTP